jgi:hypothetical protein
MDKCFEIPQDRIDTELINKRNGDAVKLFLDVIYHGRICTQLMDLTADDDYPQLPHFYGIAADLYDSVNTLYTELFECHTQMKIPNNIIFMQFNEVLLDVITNISNDITKLSTQIDIIVNLNDKMNNAMRGLKSPQWVSLMISYVHPNSDFLDGMNNKLEELKVKHTQLKYIQQTVFYSIQRLIALRLDLCLIIESYNKCMTMISMNHTLHADNTDECTSLYETLKQRLKKINDDVTCIHMDINEHYMTNSQPPDITQELNALSMKESELIDRLYNI